MVKKRIAAVWVINLVLGLFHPAEGQQTRKVPLVGYLSPGFPNAQTVEAFREGLRALGYIEGKNIVVEYRYAEGKGDLLSDLAASLVSLNVDVIVVSGGDATLAAKNATRTIPIVMGAASDPVGSGLVASLSHPGGNITGLTLINPDVSGKRLELIKETIPKVTRIAALLYRANPAATLILEETQNAAQSLGLKLQVLEVRRLDELENAFGLAKKGRSEAINVLASAFFTTQRKEIVQLAARAMLPAMYVHQDFVEAGGLISYGANQIDLFRRSATYVDKILKGAKPADLPVEQPTKFELAINLKTAKQIGVTIPQFVLFRADKVIK
jgi:putative ABC transport system substrate-binding protein